MFCVIFAASFMSQHIVPIKVFISTVSPILKINTVVRYSLWDEITEFITAILMQALGNRSHGF